MVKLTNEGIEEADEVIEYELPKKEPPKELNPYEDKKALLDPQPEPSTKEIIKEANESPEAKEHNIKVMKKSTYIFLWIFASLFFILLLVNTIWFNVSFTTKEFGTNISVTNNMPEIPIDLNTNVSINNNYQYQIANNNTININVGDALADKIAEEVLDIIKNQTNSS